MTDDIERRLWTILAHETADDRTRQIRLAEYGCRHLPTHKEHICNIIANWRNRGLVDTYHGDARVRLTDKGRRRIRDDCPTPT